MVPPSEPDNPFGMMLTVPPATAPPDAGLRGVLLPLPAPGPVAVGAAAEGGALAPSCGNPSVVSPEPEDTFARLPMGPVPSGLAPGAAGPVKAAPGVEIPLAAPEGGATAVGAVAGPTPPLRPFGMMLTVPPAIAGLGPDGPVVVPVALLAPSGGKLSVESAEPLPTLARLCKGPLPIGPEAGAAGPEKGAVKVGPVVPRAAPMPGAVADAPAAPAAPPLPPTPPVCASAGPAETSRRTRAMREADTMTLTRNGNGSS